MKFIRVNPSNQGDPCAIFSHIGKNAKIVLSSATYFLWHISAEFKCLASELLLQRMSFANRYGRITYYPVFGGLSIGAGGVLKQAGPCCPQGGSRLNYYGNCAGPASQRPALAVSGFNMSQQAVGV